MPKHLTAHCRKLDTPWLSGFRSCRLVTGEFHAPAPPFDLAHNASVKLCGFSSVEWGTVIVDDKPLNSAAVPVWTTAPLAPKATPPLTSPSWLPTMSLASPSSGQCETRSARAIPRQKESTTQSSVVFFDLQKHVRGEGSIYFQARSRTELMPTLKLSSLFLLTSRFTPSPASSSSIVAAAPLKPG